MQHSPTEEEKHQHANPEDPLVLSRASFHHANGIPTDSQGVRNAVQSSLRALEHLALLSQVGQYCATPVQEFVQLVARVAQERLLAQCVRLPVVVGGGRAEAESR